MPHLHSCELAHPLPHSVRLRVPDQFLLHLSSFSPPNCPSGREREPLSDCRRRVGKTAMRRKTDGSRAREVREGNGTRALYLLTLCRLPLCSRDATAASHLETLAQPRESRPCCSYRPSPLPRNLLVSIIIHHTPPPTQLRQTLHSALFTKGRYRVYVCTPYLDINPSFRRLPSAERTRRVNETSF